MEFLTVFCGGFLGWSWMAAIDAPTAFLYSARTMPRQNPGLRIDHFGELFQAFVMGA